jgi:hypothetical protein
VIGAQTVTVRSAQDGSRDRKNIPVTNYVDATWVGVSLQPMELRENVTNIDYLINKYRLIGPPTPVGLAVKTTDEIIDANNVTYRVIGTKIPPKVNGTPHHVEVMLETPSGLN